MNPKIPLLLVSLLLAGCASTKPMVLGPDHPANPDALAAPVAPPSELLALSSNPTTARSVPTTDIPHEAEGEHAGHDMSHMHHGGDATAQSPASKPATSQPNVAAVYTCPHHPEVVSDKPGKCPKCKMKLVKKGGAQ